MTCRNCGRRIQMLRVRFSETKIREIPCEVNLSEGNGGYSLIAPSGHGEPYKKIPRADTWVQGYRIHKELCGGTP